MIHVLALFPKDIDPQVSDDLIAKMIPAFKQIAGLQSIKISNGQLMSPDGSPPYSKVVEASIESLEDFMAWAQSPAAQADNDLFIANDITRVFYEINDV